MGKINTSKLMIDERMRKIEKEKLIELGYELIEVKKSENVYIEISSHVDIFACKIDDKIIIEPSQYEKLKFYSNNYIKGNEFINEKYPYDIKYNVCTIGKKALHNFEYTDSKIKEELNKKGYELINTTQGYTNCSIAIIDENSAIVTDKGLFKILQKHNVDVLYLKDELDIKLYNEKHEYSNKKGFIGGAIARLDENVIVFGDLGKIDKDKKIEKFIKNKNLNIIQFGNLDIVDYGGIIKI